MRTLDIELGDIDLQHQLIMGHSIFVILPYVLVSTLCI